MALTCPMDLDIQRLRNEVMNIYTRVATDPSGDFHFHREQKHAAEFLGYDPVELESLPSYGNVKGKYSSKIRGTRGQCFACKLWTQERQLRETA